MGLFCKVRQNWMRTLNMINVMGSDKINVLLSTFNLLLVLIGYQFVATIFSSQMESEGVSQIVTIPYRAVSVILSITIILRNYREKCRINFIVKVLWFYWLLLLIRFFYDFTMKSNIHVESGSIIKVIMYMVPMTLVPMFAVMKSIRFIDINKLFTWTYYTVSFLIILIFVKQNLGFGAGEYARMQASMALGSLGTGQLGLIALIMAFSVLYRKQHYSMVKKILSLFILVTGLLILLRSGSRGPLLILICLFVMYILAKVRVKIISFALVGIIVLFLYLLYNNLLNILDYFSPMLHDRILAASGNQLETREVFYEDAINSFFENPLFGGAFAHYDEGVIMYTHNAFLDSLMQLGIFGVILVYLYIKPIYLSISFLRERDSKLWIGLFLSQSIIYTMLSSSFYNSYEISILIVLLYTYPYIKKIES